MIQKLNGASFGKYENKTKVKVTKSVERGDSINISQKAKMMGGKKVANTSSTSAERIAQAKINLEKYNMSEQLPEHVARKIAEKIVERFDF